MKENKPVVKEDGGQQQNNKQTPDVVPRPKSRNLNRRKVSLMKEYSRNLNIEKGGGGVQT